MDSKVIMHWVGGIEDLVGSLFWVACWVLLAKFNVYNDHKVKSRQDV